MKSAVLPILATARVRAVDARAIASFGLSGAVLMERAGALVVERILTRWPHARVVLVVAGPGNNGGDGYVIARLLRDRGLSITVAAPLGPPIGGGDAAAACQRYSAAGGRIVTEVIPAGASLVVDALFGTGLTRSVDGAAQAVIEAINREGVPVIAVDTPSGLDTELGHPRPVAVRADETLTFVAAKPGFYLGEGPDHTGRLEVHGLGIPDSAYADERPVMVPIGPEDIARCLPRRARTAHKGANGRVVIVGGGPGMPGAVRLAGEAALRVGAGLVTVLTHPSHAAAVAMACPELICLGLDAGPQARAVLAAADVVAVGPGLGHSAWGRELYAEAISTDAPLVLDADALNRLAEQPMRRAHWVLTPHPGEAGRLLGSGAEAVQSDRLTALAQLVERTGGVVVLKGAGTLIASADHQTPRVCVSGNPGMATAGMGDVLTGVIAGIAAQQSSPRDGLYQAAVAGVQVHAQAGDYSAYAEAYANERGLIARDVLAALRRQVNP